MKILRDNVLVKDVKPMESNVEGLILPDAGMRYGEDCAVSGRRYDAEVGTVVDVGSYVNSIGVGDKVFLFPMKGIKYKEMKIYKQEEVLGVYN